MAAGTAVVAGTAGAVRHHQDQKYAAQDQAQYDQQMAAQEARSGAGCPGLRGRAQPARAAEGPGDPHGRGVRGQEEADPRHLTAMVLAFASAIAQPIPLRRETGEMTTATAVKGDAPADAQAVAWYALAPRT